MTDSEVDHLRAMVEGAHGGTPVHGGSAVVRETFRGRVAWEGEVQVFNFADHPTASVCYAWSSPVEGSDRRRFYAVLGVPPINSAAGGEGGDRGGQEGRQTGRSLT